MVVRACDAANASETTVLEDDPWVDDRSRMLLSSNKEMNDVLDDEVRKEGMGRPVERPRRRSEQSNRCVRSIADNRGRLVSPRPRMRVGRGVGDDVDAAAEAEADRDAATVASVMGERRAR
jgi:enamine deaminase RidA (YjgF/YER057c/UK114 family)